MSLAVKTVLKTANPSNRHWMYRAQVSRNTSLNAMFRCRTASRLATSAVAVDNGLARRDGQTLKVAQTVRAKKLSLKSCQRRYALGMLTTSTRTAGRPDVIVFMAVVSWLRKVATEVMVPTDAVHRSLPPIRTVTY